MLDSIRRHPAIAIVYAGYVTGWTLYGVLADRPATLAYLATMILVFVAVSELDARIRFSDPVLWIFCAWGFAHMAGGLVPVGDGVLYNASFGSTAIRYDRVVHAIGFGTAAVACWQALCETLDARPPVGVGLAALVALMGMGVGAVNEVIEFFASQTFAANVGGYRNTGWDLVANLVGCVAAGALLAARSRKAVRA